MGRRGYAEVLGYRRRSRLPVLVIGSTAAVVLATGAFAAGRSSVSPFRPAVAASDGSNPATTTTSWPGASHMDAGAPVGYADTEMGAVEAATNFDALEEGELVTDPAAYRAAYQVIVAPNWSSQGADHAERALADASTIIAAAHTGQTVRLRDIGLSYHVDSFSAAAAEVTVWAAVALGIDGTVPATLASHTAHYSLQWLGDWKVAGRSQDQPGPGLRVLINQPQTSALPPELGIYRGYHDVP